MNVIVAVVICQEPIHSGRVDVVALELIARANVLQCQRVAAVPKHNSTTTTTTIAAAVDVDVYLLLLLLLKGVSCHCVVAVHFAWQHIAGHQIIDDWKLIEPNDVCCCCCCQRV